MPPIADLKTAKRIGMIVPSSNTAVETMTISICNSLNAQGANIIPIFTRIRVLTLGTDEFSRSQFNTHAFIDAAQLLADAKADVILWNGTSGMFVGGTLQDDQNLAKAMTDATGVPCSTTTLATIEALERFKVKDISIAVPYTPELTAKLDEFFTKEGYDVHKALCMDKTPPTNIDIAKCKDEEIKDVIKRSMTPKTKVVLVACTNWPGTRLASNLEKELDTLILDSIAVTAWQGLRMMEIKGVSGVQEWGKMFERL